MRLRLVLVVLAVQREVRLVRLGLLRRFPPRVLLAAVRAAVAQPIVLVVTVVRVVAGLARTVAVPALVVKATTVVLARRVCRVVVVVRGRLVRLVLRTRVAATVATAPRRPLLVHLSPVRVVAVAV